MIQSGSADWNDAALLRREREAIWRKQWLLVGHVSEFSETGAFRTVDVAGEGAVVVNGGDGLRALANSCLHRANPFCTEGAGVAERFTCPFHGWIYDVTGRLLDVDVASDMRLPTLPLDVWGGWIFVLLARSTSPHLSRRLAAELERSPEPLTPLHTAAYDVARSWRELIGLPWEANSAPTLLGEGVSIRFEGGEKTLLIEPALSALRFRRGVITTHTLRPTGARSSQWTITWYIGPPDDGSSLDEVQTFIARDREELARHLAGDGVARWRDTALSQYERMLDVS